MKQELQDKLIEVIGSIQSAATDASDFAIEQLPEIAQQYVLYGPREERCHVRRHGANFGSPPQVRALGL